MKQYVKKFKKQFILGPAFKLSEAILELFIPLIMAKIVDVGIGNGNTTYILKMGGLMILLGALGFSFAVICQYSAATAQQGIGTLLRRDVFRQIHALSKEQQESFGSGTLTTRILNDINQIQSAVAMFIRLAFRWPFIILGSLLAAAVLDVKLSVIFFVAALLLSVLLYYVLSRSFPIYRKIQKKTDTISAITEDALAGVRVIRAFQKSRFHQNQFEGVNDTLTKYSLRVSKLNACLNPLSFALLNLCIVLLLWLGGNRIAAGTFSQGQLIALTNYMTQILLAIMIFSNVIVIFTKAAASVERVEEILQTSPSLKEGHLDQIEDTVSSAITLEDVSFSYNTESENSLSKISLKIKKGSTIGLLGATGSGKSTLAKLLCRLYDVQSGCVKIFGKDIKSYSNAALHDAVHMVSQGNPMFRGTVRENLVCGKKDITDDAVWDALETAEAIRFIRDRKDGLNSMVLEGGRNFSGGQRQRICIARALLGQPKIIIFDDAFSALDFATESAILKNLSKMKNDTTLIFITQRVRPVLHADTIILLDDGQFAGQGSHQELFASNAIYREICKSQNVTSQNEGVTPCAL